MTDYSQGKIYKLYIPGIEDICYVGSTINSLEWRLSHHRHQASNTNQSKTGSTCLFEEGNEVVIELLESYPCDTKQELMERERYWIEKFPDGVNKNIPTRGWRERWYANHNHNLEKHREWLQNNAEKVAEYIEGRKDIEKQQQQERYVAGYKDVRNAKKKEKVECDVCKKLMNKNSLWTHKNTVHKTVAQI